ncbi:hypothetical protein HJG60_007891 [Phyllostomus discolor]|uniref:Uncharacterized protein n=1 Tax=Phyllostomus discolor TaxID=89673 RepID=A0A834BDB3_9CHIR|nr:hypothetical protein HJG60_007891 [Phyllostomus discolor]
MEGAVALGRPPGPPRRILSPGRDSHSTLSESLPSPSGNAADHIGRRAGSADPGDPRRDWECCREGRALWVPAWVGGASIPPESSLVFLSSMGWGAGREGDRSPCLFVTTDQSDLGPETAEGTLAEKAG